MWAHSGGQLGRGPQGKGRRACPPWSTVDSAPRGLPLAWTSRAATGSG